MPFRPKKATAKLLAVCYLVSIWNGLGTLLRLTGALQPYEIMKNIATQSSAQPAGQSQQQEWPIPSIYDRKITRPSSWQIVLFALGTGLIVVTGIIVTVPWNDKSNDTTVLSELEARWEQAYAKRNPALLDRIIGNDFVLTNANGEMLDKYKLLNSIASNDSVLQSGDPVDLKIRVFGGGAVVSGIHSFNSKVAKKNPTSHVRYTNIYVRNGKDWQMVSRQETALKR
jgi:hypothetical protein